MVSLFAAGGLACLAQDAASSVNGASVLSRARDHAAGGRPHQAISLLEGVAVAGRSFEVNVLLGQVYEQVNRLGDARVSYRAAISERPTASEAHRLLGGVYFAEGKWALAGRAYESAERLGVDSAELHARLAWIFHRRGNCLGRVETRVLASAQVGQVWEDGYVIEAVPAEEGLFFVAPRASAIYHLQRALDLGLNDVGLVLLQADVWLGAGRHERALRIYRTVQADALSPEERGPFHYHFAQACLGADDVEGYLAHLRRAIALAPEDYPDALAVAYRTLAGRAAADGDLGHYIGYLEEALHQSPDDADLHYRLGNAFHEAGRGADAARHWLIALELRPDHPERRKVLERIERAGDL